MFYLLPVFLHAQENDSAYKAIRNSYIENKTQLLAVSFFNKNPGNNINITGENRLQYFPNDPNSIGLRIQHKWLGLAAGFTPPGFQLKDRGKTSELDLHVFVYGKKSGFDAYFLTYKGFYIENFAQNDTLNKYYATYPMLPEMRMLSTGMNFFHIFNHKKFSMRSTFLHNEVQKRSAGSFVMNFSASYLYLYNPTAFLPSELDQIARTKEKFEKGSFYSLSAMPGYAHTFVYKKKWYLTFNPSLGLVGQYQSFRVESEDRINRVTASLRGMVRGGGGYNGERLFVAVTGFTDTYNYDLDKRVRLEMVMSEVRFIMGYRFKTTGILKKASDMMDSIPLKY